MMRRYDVKMTNTTAAKLAQLRDCLKEVEPTASTTMTLAVIIQLAEDVAKEGGAEALRRHLR